MSKLKGTFNNLPLDTQALLQDLSPALKEVAVDKNDWVYQYRPKNELATAMYKDFIEYNKKKSGGKGNNFIFSDDLPENGILSLTQAFQTIVTMISDLDLNDKKCTQQITTLLDKILDETLDPSGNYHFNATPYLADSGFFHGTTYSYIDTITWVMSSILSASRLHKNKLVTLTTEQLEKMYTVFNHCMEYITDNFIENSKNASAALSCGWNFTAGCTQPSLYFTFAVTEVLIDFYTTFENVISVADQELLTNKIDEVMSLEESRDYLAFEIEQKKQQVRDSLKIEISDEDYQIEKDLFLRLNGKLNVYSQNSMYATLEEQCKKVARQVWKTVKSFRGGLNENFFTADLSSTVDEDSLEKSISSDAVFNSLFIINILMNSGLDEDYDDEVNYFTVNGSEKYNKALDDYDEIRDAIRFAYDNAYLAYSRLVKKGKEYKINEYSLNFDEKFPESHIDIVKELRKAHIRVFSLMPLLVKAKTTMSEFVIKYPQYDMQIYLENILEYRCFDEEDPGSRLWIWEKDGYSSSSNYYFASALADFYRYYEKYEETSTKNQSATRSSYLKELKKPTGEIGKLEAESQAQQATILELKAKQAELQKQYDELEELYNNDPLRKVFTEFVRSAIADYLNSENIGSLLHVLSKDLVQSAKTRVSKVAERIEDGAEKFPVNAFERYEEKDYSTLEKGVCEFGKALYAESSYEKTYNKKRVSDVDAEQAKISAAIANDMRKAFRYYIEGPAKSPSGSDYVRTKGYNGLVDVLKKENENPKSDN